MYTIKVFYSVFIPESLEPRPAPWLGAMELGRPWWAPKMELSIAPTVRIGVLVHESGVAGSYWIE